MSHQKILALLEGRDSTRPMRFDDLREASGLLPATLTLLLDQMANAIPASINRATITKGGLTQMMVWPTGVIASSRGSQSIVINPNNSLHIRRAPQRAELFPQPKQTTQETTVETKPVTLKQIRDMVATNPQIDREALMRIFVVADGSNHKQVMKTISNAINNKVLKQTLVAGVKHLELGIKGDKEPKKMRVSKVAQPAQVASEAPKVATTQAPAVQAAKPVMLLERDPDVYFGLNLDDQNHLHITVGDEDLMLFPEQTQRLHRFLSRIQIGPAA